MYCSELFETLDLNPLATLYMDFEKAFDKVCHEKLNAKLRAIGIAGGAQTLLESYFTERYQKVKTGSTESTASQLLSGSSSRKCLWTSIIQSVYRRSPRNNNHQPSSWHQYCKPSDRRRLSLATVFQKYDEIESRKMQTTEHHGRQTYCLEGDP